MNKQQQELYEKLLKKVNEFCLGQAAEDVIECIDNLVDNYERVNHLPENPYKVARELLKDTTPLQEINTPIWVEYTENSDNDKLCYRRCQIDVIEKALKALEIIKKKDLLWSIDWQPFKDSGDYRAWDNELYQSIKLTKEEYELLKEVLK